MSDAQSLRDGASSVTSVSVTTPSRRISKVDQAAVNRRMSMSRRPSVAGLSHMSNVGFRHGLQQSTVKYENTYRMEPEERHRFHPTMVSKILGKCALACAICVSSSRHVTQFDGVGLSFESDSVVFLGQNVYTVCWSVLSSHLLEVKRPMAA
jgi:hypothetical protein